MQTRLAKRDLLGRQSLDETEIIILYENEKFTKTDSQLPIDPDPRASLIALNETLNRRRS